MLSRFLGCRASTRHSGAVTKVWADTLARIRKARFRNQPVGTKASFSAAARKRGTEGRNFAQASSVDGARLFLPLALRGSGREESLGGVESGGRFPTYRARGFMTKAPGCRPRGIAASAAPAGETFDFAFFASSPRWKVASLFTQVKMDQRFAVASAGRVVPQKSAGDVAPPSKR